MRAGHNVTTDGPPRAESTELAGQIWPAGRTLPTPEVDDDKAKRWKNDAVKTKTSVKWKRCIVKKNGQDTMMKK